MTPIEILTWAIGIWEKLSGTLMSGFQRRSISQNEHDKNVFIQLDATMNEETLLFILNGLHKQIYRLSQVSPMDKFVQKATLTSFSFSDKKIHQKLKNLVDGLCSLQDFRFMYFEPTEKLEEDFLVVFSRDAKRNEETHNRLTIELENLLNAVEKSYREYRSLVRDRLFV